MVDQGARAVDASREGRQHTRVRRGERRVSAHDLHAAQVRHPLLQNGLNLRKTPDELRIERRRSLELQVFSLSHGPQQSDA